MPERDFEPSRMLWLGPLTILSSIVGVLATRRVGLVIVQRPPRFDMLSVGPSILDTFILVTIAIFVFTGIVSSAAERPRRRYRLVAFVALLVSFLPDLLLLRSAPWPPVAILMAEHVAAWFVTVELLTRIA
ncbi:MAG TPA: hypothetical protein VFP91_01970 [Vicinamibacterales bacterium]|nr:hypothetical protein [Vicinamibacterales bacterium]